MASRMESAARPFGAQLKALRDAAGFTEEELATIAGLSVHAISALERGERRRPHGETVLALSAALDLTGPTRDALLASARAPAQATAVEELSGVPLPLPPTRPLSLWVSNDRELDEASAVGDPTPMVEIGRGQRVSTGEGQRHVALQ